MMSRNRPQSISPFAMILGLLFLFMMIWIAISAVKGIFAILTWLALPLFIVAIVLNYTVVTDYFKFLWRTIRQDTPKGILYAIGSFIGYPLVAAYMAFKAYTTRNQRKLKKEAQEKKGEYIKYEEVEDDFLELPDLNEQRQKEILKEGRNNNEYEDLF